MFYEFNQNNSGGSFDVTDTLCHRVIVEADSESEALEKWLDLGVYLGGVYDWSDCSCCGDRWYTPSEFKIDSEGYTVSEYSMEKEEEFLEKYKGYDVRNVKEWKLSFWRYKIIEWTIHFRNIEEYAQFLADKYGWTTPDVRIFYKDWTVKEIFKKDNS